MAKSKSVRVIDKEGVVFVLVKPQMAENVGMSARAIANFGFSNLRIVTDKQDAKEAVTGDTAMSCAKSAASLLSAQRVFLTLEQAVADCDFLFALSARQRFFNIASVSLSDLASYMRRGLQLTGGNCTDGEPHPSCKLAIIFGPEAKGLDNESVALTDCLVTIDTASSCSSVNLSVSAALLAYELDNSFFTESSSSENEQDAIEQNTSGQNIAAATGNYRKNSSWQLYKPSEPYKQITFNTFILELLSLLERSGYFRNKEKKASSVLKLKVFLKKAINNKDDLNLSFRILHHVKVIFDAKKAKNSPEVKQQSKDKKDQEKN